MNEDLLNRILEAVGVGENTDWEFKSARGGFPGSFWETYSAFANSEGGIIVLGARQDGDGVRLDGLSAPQLLGYQKTLWDGLNNRQKVSRCLLTNKDVQVVPLGASGLLSIRVPRAERGVRPVYLGPTPFENSYRRNHEGDYRCADDEVRRMLADADPTPADHRILKGFSLEDIDPASLTQYRQRFLSSKGEHAWLSLADKELLERLGGWRKDRVSGAEGLTLAGLLMFGKDKAIRDPEAAPNYFVDYREKLDPKTRWTDRVYPDGTWEANVFQFYLRVWPKLSAGLPAPFQIEGGMRRDETPAHEALREAFVNSLIHADYSAPGGIVFERYPDKFILENPGTLLVSLEQFRRGGVSECRNKALQKMFLMIGGGEQAGSGVDKIRAGWKSRQWRLPLIGFQSNPDRVKIILPMVSLIPDATLEHLRKLFGTRLDHLTASQIQAMATADIEGEVSNARLQELLSDHPTDISRMLFELREQGLLESDNRRRWTRYHLPSLAGSSGSGVDSSGLAVDSSGLAVDSSGLMEDVVLRELAAPVAAKKKVSAKEMATVLKQLCQGRFLTLESLSRLLKRNPQNLRNAYLTPMVREGSLRLRYPESPNRPDQAYTKAEEKA